jgi:hypothetical protein
MLNCGIHAFSVLSEAFFWSFLTLQESVVFLQHNFTGNVTRLVQAEGTSAEHAGSNAAL